jgi:hypothetical protein
MHFGTEDAAGSRIGSITDRETYEKSDYTTAFLNFKNPKKVEDAGHTEAWSAEIRKAKREGYDGLVYVNRGEDIGSTSWVAFAPEQIKSATDNAGTYSNENKSMLFQLNQSPDTGTSGGASADNKVMTPEKRQEYEAFVKGAWSDAANHKKGEPIEKEEFVISKDENGRHLTDAQRIRHIYKTHANKNTEKSCGNIAITNDDIVKILSIIGNADYLIKNILYDNKKTIIYAKHNDLGTYIYIERPSNRKHGNITETFYNIYKQKDVKVLLRMLENNKRYSNIDKAEIITGSGGGGNPSGQGDHYTVPAAATSAHPADTSSSTTSPEKSTPPSSMEELFQLQVKGVDEGAGDAARMGAIQKAYEAARTDERGRLREFGRFADMVAAVRDEPDAEALKEALGKR